MVRKYRIAFREVQEPIRQLVTKFGGQPVWLAEPQWPLSRSTDEPMRFICQIALPTDVFGSTAARMAYLFMSAPDEDVAFDLVPPTWEPDTGENAVILQPGRPALPTSALHEGPTLFDRKYPPEVPAPINVACEFAVDLALGHDPEFVPFAERRNWTTEQHEANDAQAPLHEHKIGGAPCFLQWEEFPQGGPWRLLLQLSSCGIPFEINFGDCGVGYAFNDHQGTSAKFLWQCN